jgi:hypothetical protein
MGWVRLGRLRCRRRKRNLRRFLSARPPIQRNQARGASDFYWILDGASISGMRNDAARDRIRGGQSGNFQKTGNFIAASSSLAFDDGDWRAVDLVPHDWAVELPS